MRHCLVTLFFKHFPIVTPRKGGGILGRAVTQRLRICVHVSRITLDSCLENPHIDPTCLVCEEYHHLVFKELERIDGLSFGVDIEPF